LLHSFPTRRSSDLFNADDDMMDYQRCVADFIEAANRAPDEILDHLFDRLDAFRGDVPLGDDVTFVVVEARA
jgi:serine phosphatase RsbU (regulator of sigma subunit)